MSVRHFNQATRKRSLSLHLRIEKRGVTPRRHCEVRIPPRLGGLSLRQRGGQR